MPKRGERQPALTRFLAKVDRSGDCWEWRGHRMTSGYGQLWHSDERRMTTAHRFAYELFDRPIPEGLQIDHLCRNRGCVKPSHLELVTTQENTRRGFWGDRTDCLRGHEYTAENTYRDPQGRRHCRACIRLRRERAKCPT